MLDDDRCARIVIGTMGLERAVDWRWGSAPSYESRRSVGVSVLIGWVDVAV
ncbi:MAG: hypothetical protein WBC44_13695 [Planctomycetaceae bacterium]